MITLLSSAPGGGKSSYAVWHVIKTAIDDGRQVFTVGIPELKLPTIEVDYDFIRDWSTRTINTQTSEEELDNIPIGALIVVDEAWRVWKAAGTAKVVSDDIE